MAAKRKKEKSLFTKSNRQLLGFVLLLFVFALLLYTTFVLFNEGNVFKGKKENNTAISKQDEGMTSVSIIYKQNRTNNSR
ncbi:MAG: hypothetical protein QXT72_03385 [Candidatus Micrarchaeia archaeon]